MPLRNLNFDSMTLCLFDDVHGGSKETHMQSLTAARAASSCLALLSGPTTQDAATCAKH